MYKIEEKDNKFYVIPTAETVLNNYNRFGMPYDSNWEIYKHFGFEPEDFIKYVIAAFNARVIIQYEYPWVKFYFTKYTDAENFKNEVEKRANNP